MSGSTVTSEIICPLDCVRVGCPEPDWLEKHNGFLITLIGALSASMGVFFAYCLKSRCKNIKTPCVSCDRDVVVLEPQSIEVTSTQ
tara:strand:+ start:41 stop:298 length:258 start_codon:yes stop_codon:yes gene_type:complete